MTPERIAALEAVVEAARGAFDQLSVVQDAQWRLNLRIALRALDALPPERQPLVELRGLMRTEILADRLEAVIRALVIPQHPAWTKLPRSDVWRLAKDAAIRAVRGELERG